MTTRPDLFRERRMAFDPHFDRVGHSYHITWANTLVLLGGLFDREHAFLPDPRSWEDAFRRLREEKEEGFHHGSPIMIPPVGLMEICEGEPRFIQLQYLHFTTGGRLGWDDARSMGMLGDRYVTAFREFLRMTDSE